MLCFRGCSRFVTPVCLTFGVVIVMVTGIASAQELADGVESQMVALDGELATHPRIQVTDIYKFLHQGCFGPGHAISSRSAAQSRLAEELDNPGPSAGSESLCQPLGGEPELVRIHLRPFAASGADPEALLDAFVASADRVNGDPERMRVALEKAVARLSRRGRWQQASQLEELAGQLAAEGYPAAHHSEPYVSAYRPAYRVVLRELAEANGWCHASP